MDDRGGYGVLDLATKALQIQAKKFFLDVKENKRGRFIRISEIGTAGHKNRIVMDMSTASEFHEQLTNFIEHYASLGPRADGYGDDRIKSEVIYSNERRYYMDLKENSRGRFLKVAMTMPPPSYDRQQVVIPAQGMADIRDALTDLLSEYAPPPKTDKLDDKSINEADGKQFQTESVKIKNDGESEEKLSLEAENKSFQFELGENKNGEYLRISEVSPSFRTAINIPHQIWAEFIEKLHTTTAILSASSSDSLVTPHVTLSDWCIDQKPQAVDSQMRIGGEDDFRSYTEGAQDYNNYELC